MCQGLVTLVLAKSAGIPVGIPSIFANIQSPRAWCRSPVRIAYLRLNLFQQFWPVAPGTTGQKLQKEAISRILCPRGGVHSSWPCVTARLQQPTRKSFPPKRGAGTGDPRLPYSVLLRMGFTVPSPSPERRCALTAPFHPYPPTSGGRSALCGTFPRVATAGRYPACCPSGVRTFLDDPKTAANARLLLRWRE